MPEPSPPPAARLLRLRPSAGVAGDMFVGALLSLGAPLEGVRESVDRLGVPGLRVRADTTRRSGLAAVKYRVDREAGSDPGGPGHRHWKDIAGALEGAGLDPAILERSLAVFRRLFEAEARVHGSTFEGVHLHEAGGWDALADVVGACAAWHLLELEEGLCGPVNTGRGLVETSHGTYPIPAPATAELLSGARVYAAGPEMELTTPTGAALAASLCRFTDGSEDFLLEATGYGAGDRDPEGFANVLVADLGRIGTSRRPGRREEVALLETNLDDEDPRLLGALLEDLLEQGALDAWITPIQMKKSRPGVLLSLLVEYDARGIFAERLLRETSTLGVRERRVERRVLDRRFEEVQTAWGPVRVKLGLLSGEVVQARPEWEDCLRLAREGGVPVRRIHAAALRAWEEKDGA